MDDQLSFKICVQTQTLLKNFVENVKFLFVMKVQITR